MKLTPNYHFDINGMLALFTSHMPRLARPEIVAECFESIVHAHRSRKFPDDIYLMHAQQGLVEATDRILLVHLPLRYALWFQHAVCEPHRSDNVERSVEFARLWLPKLEVPAQHVEETVTLLRGSVPGAQSMSPYAMVFADANTYARYGISWDRTNTIAVLEALHEGLKLEQMRALLRRRLIDVTHSPLYHSKHMLETHGASTRSHIEQAIPNIGWEPRWKKKKT